MSKDVEEYFKEHEGFVRKRCLHMIHTSLKYTKALFDGFKKGCEYRNGVEGREYRDGTACTHPDFHEDFALANTCKLERCPLIEKYQGVDDESV